MSSRRLTNRNTNRYSVTALFSMAAEQDVEVEDELGRGLYDFLLDVKTHTEISESPKAITGAQKSYFDSVQTQLCART
jgi:Ras GTPase-activating-like protein IQGAP2/3